MQPAPTPFPLRRPLAARRCTGLRGAAAVPGDKSISHRALILGAMAIGESRIAGLLEAEDVLRTAAALRRFGVSIERGVDGTWHVDGVGVGGFAEPDDVLDFGNSGTGSRLAMGAMATTPIVAMFTGDASLRRRPMLRVLEPLTLFGAEYVAHGEGTMPLVLSGTARPIAIEHGISVASAQVKSALLLAALNAPGRSRIAQNVLTRDHTERILRAFGADIAVEPLDGGGEVVSVMGEVELGSASIAIPRDPSSAAFPLVAALVVPHSEVSISNVLLNPRRTGLIETLREMGADLEIVNRHQSGGEEMGDVCARSSDLRGVEVPPERAASMIDEYPILAVAAAFADGRTAMRGLAELRVKESDRLTAIASGLKACGVEAQELPDALIVEGRGGGGVTGGARIDTQLDHRIAMSFLVAGLAARDSVSVDDGSMITTSFPGFRRLFRELGAQFFVPES